MIKQTENICSYSKLFRSAVGQDQYEVMKICLPFINAQILYGWILEIRNGLVNRVAA